MSSLDDERLSVEREKEQKHLFSEFLCNYERSWDTENEFHYNFLVEKKIDFKNCMKVEEQIQDLKSASNGIRMNCGNITKQIDELESQRLMLETAIRNKSTLKDDLSEQCRLLEMKTNKLKQVYRMLQEIRELYDHYFSCSLLYEPPDVYNFLFLKNNVKLYQIRFQYNDLKGRWTETEPPSILNEDVLQKFHQTQDTQGLLCHFRKYLLDP